MSFLEEVGENLGVLAIIIAVLFVMGMIARAMYKKWARERAEAQQNNLAPNTTSTLSKPIIQ